MKAITAKMAQAIARKLNRDIDGDGQTYYATDAGETEIYCFDSKADRNKFVTAYNEKIGR